MIELRQLTHVTSVCLVAAGAAGLLAPPLFHWCLALWPAVLATVGDEVGEADRATGMALFNVTYMIGLGLGPPLGLWISHASGRRAVALYVAGALLAAAALGAALLLPGTRPHGSAGGRPAEEQGTGAGSGTRGGSTLSKTPSAAQVVPPGPIPRTLSGTAPPEIIW